MSIFKKKTRADYKRSAKKWRDMHSNAQETIGYLQQRIRSANIDIEFKAKTIEKQQQEINELRIKYSESLAENIRLLERIKALMEAKV